MLNFANSTVGFKNWCCFISIKFDIEKWRICRNFVAGAQSLCGYINISSFFCKSGIQYLCKGKLVFVLVLVLLVPIKVVPVRNDYFLHSKFESHTYQQMNEFLHWRSCYRKKYGAYISHELIVRLIPTWIWFDLVTIIHFWPLNHQLFFFFNFVSLK